MTTATATTGSKPLSIGADGKTSQQRANEKQNEKRKLMHRLPSAYLNDAEDALLVKLGQIAGTKRAAIFLGLELYEKENAKINSELLAATKDSLDALRSKSGKTHREDMKRLPSAYLDHEENDLVNKMGDVAGTKRDAIFRGLVLLEQVYIAQKKLTKAGAIPR